jgi:hypothetical protein
MSLLETSCYWGYLLPWSLSIANRTIICEYLSFRNRTIKREWREYIVDIPFESQRNKRLFIKWAISSIHYILDTTKSECDIPSMKLIWSHGRCLIIYSIPFNNKIRQSRKSDKKKEAKTSTISIMNLSSQQPILKVQASILRSFRYIESF